MELIPILRELWRYRRLLVVAAILSIAIGLLTAYSPSSSGLKSRSYSVGVGATRVLLDTPASQIVDLEPQGAEGLGSRANLLANLLASGPLRERIAKLAGVPADKLLILAPSAAGPVDPSLLATSGTATAKAPEAYTVTLKADPQLPIIFVNTQAPDAKIAADLGNSTINALRDYLKSVAATQRVPYARQLVATQLGPAQSVQTTQGPSRLMAMVIAVVLFCFMCFTIVAVSGLVRGWRQAVAAERVDGVENEADEPQLESSSPRLVA
jgi:hypothetical protein